MPLLLPRQHRHAPALAASGIRLQAGAAIQTEPRLVIGIINLMPKAEDYELLLLSALGHALAELPGNDTHVVEPRFIRLNTHHYGSSDAATLSGYHSFAEVQDQSPLSGLIVTGAPVEELDYEDVRYWPELAAILARARTHVPSTLGLCWGGMALAKLLGIEKVRFPEKLFGMYPLQPMAREEAFTSTYCAQSRHAGCSPTALQREAARGNVRLRGGGEACGISLFESADTRYVMHLGHPEYDVARLVFEYDRDRRLLRDDVRAPLGVENKKIAAHGALHSAQFFGQWLAQLARKATGDVTAGGSAA